MTLVVLCVMMSQTIPELPIEGHTSTAHDLWFARDKFLHFSACAAISGLTYVFSIDHLNRDETEGAAYSISFTALIGLGKELYDKKHKGRFSWKDLFWDGAGLLVGYCAFIR